MDSLVDDLPLVSVIIVNYKQYALLENCIVSVLRSSYSNIEVIVVDNEFCVEKLELIMKKFPNVRYYPIKENLNYAEGNNYGIEVSKGDYVALLNNDTEVRTNWLEPLMEQAQKDPKAFYQPKILLLDNKDTIFSTGCTVHPTGVAYPIGLGKRIGPDDRFENIKQVFYCVGACILASKSTIREVGSLDSNYWTYYEDVNLGWKGLLMNFPSYVIPESIIYHKWAGSYGRGLSSRKVYLLERGRLSTILRNYSFRTLVLFSPWLFLLEILVFGYMSSKRLAKSKLYADIDVIRHLRMISKDRKVVQSKRILSDKEIASHMSPAITHPLLPEISGRTEKAITAFSRILMKMM